MKKFVASANQNLSSPISKLKMIDRLLGLIFMVNTEHQNRFIVTPNHPTPGLDDSKVQPLITTRHTSQVCRNWRNLILNSPTIWGSIIDLDLLCQKKDGWRKEVMRRTGSATLCISGTVVWQKSRLKSFLVSLLTEHWERIQRLDITIISAGAAYKYPPPAVVRDLRRRPTPSLEFISICTPVPPNSVLLPANYVQEICDGTWPIEALLILCPAMPKYLSAPWLPQLRAITIGWVGAHIFPLLDKMAFLETLKIELTTKLSEDFIPRNPIALPNLNFIDLRNNFQSCFLILKWIAPSPHCILQLKSHDRKPEEISSHCGNLPSFKSILKQYSTGYFGAGNITHFKIHISSSRISIGASVGPETTAQLFEFDVHPVNKLPFIVPSSLLGCVISAQLSSITTFEFELYECQKCQLLRDDFMDFISACLSVRVIQVTKKAIEVLHDLILERPTLLPSLDVLSVKINDPDKVRPEHMDYLGAILAFLTLRKEANLPVKVLDLTACETDKSENLEYRDKSLAVNIQRRAELCIPKAGRGNTREYCHSCGIAQLLDIQDDSEMGLGMQIKGI